MSYKLSGLNPRAYIGVEPQQPPDMLVYPFPPKQTFIQNFNIGSFWAVNNPTLGQPQQLWYLANIKQEASPTWVQLYPGGGVIGSLIIHPTSGVNVSPAANILNFIAGLNMVVTGTAPNNITYATVASPTFTNVTVTNTLNTVNLNVSGTFTLPGTGVVYDNANTLTVIPNGTVGFVLTSTGAGQPTWQAVPPGVGAVTALVADDGLTAFPDVIGHILIHGAPNQLTTSVPAGSEIEIAIVASPVITGTITTQNITVTGLTTTNNLTITGTLMFPGTGVLYDNAGTVTTIANGTVGFVLTSTGAGQPTWQNVSGTGAVMTLTGDTGAAAVPTAGNINIHAGLNIVTTSPGTGSQVIVATVASPTFTNATITNTLATNNFTATGTINLGLGTGVVYSNANVLNTIPNGTTGFVLTSTGATQPTWQAVTPGAGAVLKLKSDAGTDAFPTVGGEITIHGTGGITTTTQTNQISVNFALPGTGLVYDSAGTLSVINNGTNGQFLEMVAGLPAWANVSPGGVVSVTAGANINLTGTAANPIINLNTSIRQPNTDNTGNIGSYFLGASPAGVGGSRFMHAYGPTNSGVLTNTFLGSLAGNYTLSNSPNDSATVGWNTCVGVAAGNILTTGYRNTMIGADVSQTVTGFDNVYIGAFANINEGHQNVMIGNGANTTGGLISITNSIGIGFGAFQASLNCDNAINIGAAPVIGIATNKIVIGNTAHTSCSIGGIFGRTVGGGSLAVLVDSSGLLGTTPSSMRYKDNIQDISNSADIYKLRPVEFQYKNEPQEQQYGLIAEEVESVYPELVVYKDGQPETVQYHKLDALLLKEIQRLNDRISELERKLNV